MMQREKTDIYEMESEKTLRKALYEQALEIINMDIKKVDEYQWQRSNERLKNVGKFLTDREMTRRISQAHNIRIFNVISDDTEERKRYITASMPELIPFK